jgi:hypothetical protein
MATSGFAYMVYNFITRFDTLMRRADTFLTCLMTFGASCFTSFGAGVARSDALSTSFNCFMAGCKAFCINAIGEVYLEFFEAFSSTFDKLSARGDAMLVQ